jgi:ArsR family transcriptional regulator
MTSLQIDRSSAVACCAPVATPKLTDEEVDATARLFRAIGDPARVRILNVLATNPDPVCVCNLIDPLGLSQPTVSHHLKTLTDAGLLDREQRGKWAYFSLKPEAATRLASLLDFKKCS